MRSYSSPLNISAYTSFLPPSAAAVTLLARGRREVKYNREVRGSETFLKAVYVYSVEYYK
jgi:hypothetical protein